MRALITGGAASGKSVFAESLVMGLPKPRVYIATMHPYGEDGKAKVQRHRDQRAGKGFQTIECYETLEGVVVPEDSTVLLECLCNLCANTMFTSDGGVVPIDELLARHVADIKALASRCANLIVVGNDVGSDGVDYAFETQEYVRLIGGLQCALAAEFDVVAEVFHGFPQIVKGTL